MQAVVSAHRENAGVSHTSPFLTKGHCTVLFGSGSSVPLVVANVWDRRLVPETHRSSCILVRCFGHAPIDSEIVQGCDALIYLRSPALNALVPSSGNAKQVWLGWNPAGEGGGRKFALCPRSRSGALRKPAHLHIAGRGRNCISTR